MPLRKWLALLMLLSCPFVIVSVALLSRVGPMAHAAAAWIGPCRPFFEAFPGPAAALELPLLSDSAQCPAPQNGTWVSSGSTALLAGPPQRRPLASLFVGPDLVRRAVPPANRPRATFVERADGHPAGLLLQSTGALEGTLRVGDILVLAEGQPITGIEHLVVVVGRSYAKRSKYVTGRLWRRGEMLTITVEPGW